MYNTGNRKHFFLNEKSLIVIALILFLISGYLNNKITKPTLKLDKQDTAVNLNKDLLIFLSAGNKRLITDLLWVQTLLESDFEHYKSNDLNNWMYLRFLTISHLDPYFYENYLYGGQYLAIVKDDLLGAVDIYQRGLEHYPTDYRLNYHLGFTYFFELGEYEKGTTYLRNIMDDPKAPPFIRTIVNKIRFELSQDYDLALSYIQDVMSKTSEPNLLRKLKNDYYALKAERDLLCLNNKKENCDAFDAEGNRYLYKEGRFHTQKPFIRYRLKKKGDQSAPLPITTL